MSWEKDVISCQYMYAFLGAVSIALLTWWQSLSSPIGKGRLLLNWLNGQGFTSYYTHTRIGRHTHTHTRACVYAYKLIKHTLTYLFSLFRLRSSLVNKQSIKLLLSEFSQEFLAVSVIWKSDLIDKMKRSFFQAAVVSILLYGCTTWMLTKRLEKKLDGNYTRMLRAILNKSWRQHTTRHQLYGHLPPITKTIKVRRTRLAGTSS